jgi:cellulose biosynthesis protein BcsQ
VALVMAVANQKGGCGKTTLSMNIAGCLARTGYKVLLVDADPQGSAMAWRNNREESALPFDIQPYPYSTLHREMPKLIEKAGYELVVIDCPPGGAVGGDQPRADITKSALLASHVLLLPIRPTPLDYQASVTMLPMLRDVAFYRRDLKVLLAVNGKSPTQPGWEEKRARWRSTFLQWTAWRSPCSTLRFAIGRSLPRRRRRAKSSDLDQHSKGSLEFQQLTEEILQCLSQNAAA